jgi:L-lactate dehydrogenase complex protein LldF
MASTNRTLMNFGNAAIKNKVINTLFKSWNIHRAPLDFAGKTFNQQWQERKK